MTLEIHLRAGALPVKVDVVGSGSVPAALGEQFKTTVLLAGLLALLTVGFVVYYRYREPSIVIPMLAITLSEIVILLGIARFIQQLDLASIRRPDSSDRYRHRSARHHHGRGSPRRARPVIEPLYETLRAGFRHHRRGCGDGHQSPCFRWR